MLVRFFQDNGEHCLKTCISNQPNPASAYLISLWKWNDHHPSKGLLYNTEYMFHSHRLILCNVFSNTYIHVYILSINVSFQLPQNIIVGAYSRLVCWFLHENHENEFDTNSISYLIDDRAVTVIPIACFMAWWRHQMETFSASLAFVRGIHRSPVNSPHKGQWRGALMFSLISE